MPDSEHAELKPQEFARLVEQDWARAAAGSPCERAAQVPHAGVVERLRVPVGAILPTLGAWLKAQEGRAARVLEQRRPQVDQ